MALLVASSRRNEIQKNKTIVARITDDATITTHHTIRLPNHSLHYVSSPYLAAQNKPKSSVVFVHGTPGGWGSFSRYFEDKYLVNDFSINVIDRPGWGESGYDNDFFPHTLIEQSRLIGPILQDIWQKNGQQKITLVGHSLGGSLVPKIAVDYPHYVKGVIVLAGDLDPELSEARWFNKLMTWLPDVCFPKRWVHSNNEVMAIQPSLTTLQSQFADITLPITVLQGLGDGLVRPGSAIKAPEIFKSSQVEVIMLEGASHIINLTHVEEVKDAIYRMEERA
ncbi:alpha/beta fold hydrolase [Marinomonas sp. 2405UD68-3]|uniref:alpha/beta fold hydrolase n=1 Tax=Marinomonas sp. 2405UD68-3 TaxID=3391835 RepID=UPI0039C9CFB1